MSPAIVRCKVKEACDPAEKVVGFLRFEERTMPAIVEDDKCPHQETRRQDSQPKRNPIGGFDAPDHQNP